MAGWRVFFLAREMVEPWAVVPVAFEFFWPLLGLMDLSQPHIRLQQTQLTSFKNRLRIQLNGRCLLVKRLSEVLVCIPRLFHHHRNQCLKWLRCLISQ
jgi:hypothetical protein